MLDDLGKLSVRAYTAGGALPVPNATVRIYGAEEENRFSVFSLITDVDGVTVPIELSAPRREYSLTPTPSESPFARYSIEISAEGYAPQLLNDIAVFSGIYSIQPINMIPRGAATEKNETQ